MASKGLAVNKVSSRKMSEDEKQWETQSDVRALMRAEEIKKDPERMARVKVLAKKQLEEAAAIVGAASKLIKENING